MKRLVKQTKNSLGKRYKRKEVAKDDILDSIAAAIVACSPVDSLTTVPEIPYKDAKGLPMEIVFSR
jgi:predicted RNase H-like nuclease